jgi:hypothetical protein
MTNLLATVLVTVLTETNDIPRWNPQTFRDGAAEWVMYVDESSPGVPVVDWRTGQTNATYRLPMAIGGQSGNAERVRVVQTKRVTRLDFEWAGKPRTVVDEVVLSEMRTVLVRRET